MARYILTAAVVGAPPNGAYGKFPRGTSIADSAENAEPGDVVWPALTRAPNRINMAPLDAAASTAMRGAPIITLAELASSNSGGAAGENAGT
jgi:hypothetical protein